VNERGDANKCESAMYASDLEESPTSTWGRGLNLDGDKHSAGPNRSRERSFEEGLWSDRLGATASVADKHASSQRRCHGRQLGRRIGVGEAATHSSARPDRQVRDVASRFGKQRESLPDDGLELEPALAHHGADANGAVRGLEQVEAGDPVQVDKYGRPREPHVEKRDEALPAGQQARLLRCLDEGCKSFIHSFWCAVRERCRLHCAIPDAARLRAGPLTKARISSGVTGSFVIFAL
jgi:hypothetical protein